MSSFVWSLGEIQVMQWGYKRLFKKYIKWCFWGILTINYFKLKSYRGLGWAKLFWKWNDIHVLLLALVALLTSHPISRCSQLTWDGTRSKFFPSILLMCLRAWDVIWCLSRKENMQPSRMQWKWLFTWLYLQPKQEKKNRMSFLNFLLIPKKHQGPTSETPNLGPILNKAVMRKSLSRWVRLLLLSPKCHTEKVELSEIRPVVLFITMTSFIQFGIYINTFCIWRGNNAQPCKPK